MSFRRVGEWQWGAWGAPGAPHVVQLAWTISQTLNAMKAPMERIDRMT